MSQNTSLQPFLDDEDAIPFPLSWEAVIDAALAKMLLALAGDKAYVMRQEVYAEVSKMSRKRE